MFINSNDPIDEKEVFKKFSRKARKAIMSSYDLARKDKTNVSTEIAPKHLFVAILQDKTNLASRLLEKLNVDTEQTAEVILGDLGDSYTRKSFIPNETYKRVVGEAFLEAAKLGHVYVGSEHLLLSLLKFTEIDFVSDLAISGLDYQKLKSELLNFATYQPGVFSDKQGKDESSNKEDDDSTALEYFGTDMVEKASKGEYLPVLGRTKEIDRIIHILSRKTKNNPILVGEAGVGKTAVIEGLAQKVLNGDVPEGLEDMEIIQIDIASIIAGAKVRGDIEERLMAIMDEIREDDNKVVFIDEIHTIVGAGNMGGGSDIANVLKPYLTDNKMQVIGATTSGEYTKFFEEDAALNRRFQPVNIDELSQEDTYKVLEHLRNTFEQYHRVHLSNEALQAAVSMSARYVQDRYLPDKAIDLIDEAAAKKKLARIGSSTEIVDLREDLHDLELRKQAAVEEGDLETAESYRQEERVLNNKISKAQKSRRRISKKFAVKPEDIRAVVSQWTKIPVNSLTVMEIESISGVQDKLNQKIVGQVDAIKRVAGALKRAKLGFTDENRPLASMLLLGPTGVGKTETAKVVANELFGSEESLIQINMSEFMEAHSVSKLIGAPPGYVGYSDGKHITERVRKNPYSVVLFDEIEKAHIDTLNILLQILEEGYVQDSKGRRISFQNSVIVMTSNIGAVEIAQDKTLGFSVDLGEKSDKELKSAYDDMRSSVMNELKNYLKPEFINRIDELIVYRGLNEEDMKEIAKIQINQLNKRLSQRHLQLETTSAVVNLIAEEGYSKEYGARNIRRKVQEDLENNLADFILSAGLLEQLQKIEQKKKHAQKKLVVKANVDAGKIELTKI